jgi:hypothetical protein
MAEWQAGQHEPLPSGVSYERLAGGCHRYVIQPTPDRPQEAVERAGLVIAGDSQALRGRMVKFCHGNGATGHDIIKAAHKVGQWRARGGALRPKGPGAVAAG